MSLLRDLLLRRTMAAVFLLTGLFAQPGGVFACHFTGDQPQHVYYCSPPVAADCEMDGGGVALNVHATADGCVMSAVKLPGLQVVPSSTPSWLRTTLLDGPQPLLGIPPPVLSDFDFSRQILTYFERFSLPSWFPGTLTYLVTRRLRN